MPKNSPDIAQDRQQLQAMRERYAGRQAEITQGERLALEKLRREYESDRAEIERQANQARAEAEQMIELLDPIIEAIAPPVTVE